MPFDGKDFDLEIDIYTLRRRKLVKALREPLVNWDWDFASFKNAPVLKCGTVGCALGYSEVLFPDFSMPDVKENPFRAASVFFGMSEAIALDCFGAFSAELSPYGAEPSKVTPAMVADKIEELCGK